MTGFLWIAWVEGRSIAIEYRWTEGHAERLPAMAAEFVRLNMDVIVAEATPAALAAKEATSTVSIVFLNTGDPIATGLVNGLARSGGNNVLNPAALAAALREHLHHWNV